MIKKVKYALGAFKYWFAHWCAFQAIAFQFNVWRPKYLFHDCYKPWLEIFLSDKKVEKLHRKWSSHHPENNGCDYIAMVIDWECAKLTKPHLPLNSRQTMEKYYPEIKEKIEPILIKFGL